MFFNAARSVGSAFCYRCGIGDTRDIVRLPIAGLLLTAACLKAHQLTTEPIYSTGLFGYRPFLIGLVEGELGLGVWLISGRASRWARTVALASFLVFGCASFGRALTGEPSCGCFGAVTLSPWVALALDLVVVFALCKWRPRETSSVVLTRECIALFALFCVIGGLGAWRMRRYALPQTAGTQIPVNASSVAITPYHWIGRRLPLLPWIDVAPKLEHGTWTVILFRSACPHCRDTIRRHERQFTTRGPTGAPKMAIIELPPWETRGFSTTKCLHGHLSDTKTWFARVPIEIELTEGIVQAVSDPDESFAEIPPLESSPRLVKTL